MSPTITDTSPPAAQRTAMVASGAEGNKPKPKILLVDDLLLNRVILSRMFTKLGFEVLEAQNGQECIDVFNVERAGLSCIFLDLKMPVMDGWQTAQHLRSMEQESDWHRMPIVACTATEFDEKRKSGGTVFNEALACGFDECVGKPLSLKCLTEVLERNLPAFSCSQTAASSQLIGAATSQAGLLAQKA